MDIQVKFPGGKRVDASFAGHVVHTDQPAELGGTDSAPSPFDLFLASLATCAGIYIVGFCQARGLATDGFSVLQKSEVDPKGEQPAKVELTISFPPDFPEKYKSAVIRAAEGCKVKKTIAVGMEILVREG